MAQDFPNLEFEAMLGREFRPSNTSSRVEHRPNVSADDDENESKKEVKRTRKRNPNPLYISNSRHEEETTLLVHSLITQTPAYRRHLEQQEQRGAPAEPKNTFYERFTVPVPKKRRLSPIPREFHDILSENWESKICYDGIPPPQHGPIDPLALLNVPRNHHLDNMDFMTAVKPHTRQDFLRKAQSVPLTLELGVAGQSVAKTVFSTMVLKRPPAADKSEAYKRRITSPATALLSQRDEKGAEDIQGKQVQMAKDKASRVREAMGSILVNRGRGRTVASQLMGPGGTEPTGRPTVVSRGHTTWELPRVEQLDIVNQHTLVPFDWSKVYLRQHLRPKLPLSVVQPRLAWQFQIRPAAKKAKLLVDGVFHTMPHTTAASKERLRVASDLSPTEGKLILLEYCEERPPIQMTKGMCSKIVNYYRGDRTRCPVSAGGGDRPSRRKHGSKTSETLMSKVESTRASWKIEDSNVLDWVGKLPNETTKGRAAQSIDVIPEGVTELMHDEVHGPFLGPIKEGQTVTGLVSNIFVAPLFLQPPQTTDFLMILTEHGGASCAGRRETMSVVLRDLPSSTFTVGQTEPRTKVHVAKSPEDKKFTSAFLMFQIGRHLMKSDAGLTFEQLKERVLPSLKIPEKSFRHNLKNVATLADKHSDTWTLKPLGCKGFQGFGALKKQLEPECVAAFEAASAARRRLKDLGIEQLVENGPLSVISTGVVMVYLSGQLTATHKIYNKIKKDCEHLEGLSKSHQVLMYERARDELGTMHKTLEKRYEVAQFIHEELQLAPWNITKDFIDVHINGKGGGMMRLTGLGDPSGTLGEGFSFIRALGTKPVKSAGTTIAVNNKIAGTQDDLRKLNMQNSGKILREFGMTQANIDGLKRWDRINCIRNLSTHATSDGNCGDLEGFARCERMKVSDRKAEYTKRIEMISERQRLALSATGIGGPEGEGGPSGDADGDDFLAEIEEDLTTQDQNVSGEARELASFQREDKKAQEVRARLKSMKASETICSGRKVIRRRTTQTHPDGRQTTTFKFIMNPDEVRQIMDRLEQDGAANAKHLPSFNYERGEDEKVPGHAMFEDEDDFDYS